MASIAVIFVPAIVSRSWTLPYWLEATSLVTVFAFEDDGVVLVVVTAAVGVAAAGAWAWNPSAAAVPMTVALRTMGARLICGSWSEREGLVVDVRVGDAGPAGRGDERVLERLGSAHVDVALGDVGHELGQRLGVEPHAVARADELEQPSVATRDVLGHLVAQDEVRGARAAQDDDDVGVLGQLLEQRADRRDADAGADEQHAVAVARVGGEHAVRALDREPRAGPQPRERGAVVAEGLDGDAQVARGRCRRQRVRVRLPPQAARQEAPLQELA